MSLQVRVITPDGIFIDTNAEELILQTITGQIGILPGHAPLLTALDIGPIILQSDKTRTSLALIAGTAFVEENKVTVLVNEAMSSASINKRDAEKALEEAQNQLKQSTSKREEVEAIFALKRAKTRYQIATLKDLRVSVSIRVSLFCLCRNTVVHVLEWSATLEIYLH